MSSKKTAEKNGATNININIMDEAKIEAKTAERAGLRAAIIKVAKENPEAMADTIIDLNEQVESLSTVMAFKKFVPDQRKLRRIEKTNADGSKSLSVQYGKVVFGVRMHNPDTKGMTEIPLISVTGRYTGKNCKIVDGVEVPTTVFLDTNDAVRGFFYGKAFGTKNYKDLAALPRVGYGDAKREEEAKVVAERMAKRALTLQQGNNLSYTREFLVALEHDALKDDKNGFAIQNTRRAD